MSEDRSLTPKSGAERKVPLAAELERRLRDAVKDKLPRARVVLDAKGKTPSRLVWSFGSSSCTFSTPD